MSRKLLLYLILGVIVVVFFITFMIFKNGKGIKEEPLKAVPVDVGIIVKINDFKGLTTTFKSNSLWNELKQIDEFSLVNQQLNSIDSLTQHNSGLKSVIFNNPSYISVHPTGKGKVGFLHFLRIPDNLNERKIHELVKNLVGNEGIIKSRKYDGKYIYDADVLNSKNSFSYTVSNGLILISKFSILIEDALRQLSEEISILDDKDFLKALNAQGKNVTANVFINYRQFPKIVSYHLNNSHKQKVKNYDYFASWAELDLNVKENTFLLNGFTIVSDSVMQLLNLFNNQSPKRLTSDNILPSTISSFLSISLSDVNRYFDHYSKFLSERGDFNKYQQKISDLKLKYGINLQETFINLLDGEITLALGKSKDTDSETDFFTVFKIKSQNQAERNLTGMLKNIAEKNSVPDENYRQDVQIDNELFYPVYKLPVENFLSDYFGSFFGSITGNFFTIIDGYLVFGNSVKSLTEFIRSNILKVTLITEPAYLEYKESLAPRSTISFYADLSKSPFSYSNYLSQNILTKWEEKISVFHKVQVFGFQVNGGNNLMYTNIFLRSVPEYKDKPRTVWESLLDTVFNSKPQLVINHTNNQSEIFLQDLGNNIYLINHGGRILWKQNLSEPITSNIYQIDYYNNGKLQILFSTKNYIHLIDRNGNYIERYPLKLRAPATNGLALIDYDSNKNYRLFIACSDKKIYVYTKEGTLLPGWSFGETEGAVNQPVNLFQADGKDYIVFGDELNTYILDRKGNRRIEVKDLIPRSLNNTYHFQNMKSTELSFITTTDTSGIVYRIFLDGKIEKTDFGKFKRYHFFDFKDLDGDAKKEYVFLDEQKLHVFKSENSLFFDFYFDEDIQLPPVFYSFTATDRKIGVVSRKLHQIFLINNDGTLYKGFPLQGNTLFSIGNFGNNGSQFNLVVGGEDNFLYNYIVQ